MPKPCSKPLCAGQGHFDGDQCPGSDDEMHHCNDCGELAWENKGNYCERCGKYWCVDYQHVFIGYDCSEKECDVESMCSECFLADPSLWCENLKCLCSFKRAEVQKEYLQFKAHGSWCGNHILEKDDQLCSISVYRFNGEEKGRVTCGKQEFLFDKFAKALDHAKNLIVTYKNKGFQTRQCIDYLDRNPWGYLK